MLINVCMCIYLYMCICVFICTYLYLYIFIFVHIYICTYLYPSQKLKFVYKVYFEYAIFTALDLKADVELF